jgi:ribosomal protein S30
MAYPQDDKRARDAPTTKHCTPKIPAQPRKRWIPLDLVQNTAEYLGRVPSLLSFRGVSTGWQDAVSDAVGFLNGRCWTELEYDRPLWTALGLDRRYTVARLAVLCLGRRLKTLVILVNGSSVLLVNHNRDDLVTGRNH